MQRFSNWQCLCARCGTTEVERAQFLPWCGLYDRLHIATASTNHQQDAEWKNQIYHPSILRSSLYVGIDRGTRLADSEAMSPQIRKRSGQESEI
jgi:hypothetical protein